MIKPLHMVYTRGLSASPLVGAHTVKSSLCPLAILAALLISCGSDTLDDVSSRPWDTAEGEPPMSDEDPPPPPPPLPPPAITYSRQHLAIGSGDLHYVLAESDAPWCVVFQPAPGYSPTQVELQRSMFSHHPFPLAPAPA